MQCTGLKDVSGALIYEGDILRAVCNKKTFTLAVRFGEHRRADGDPDYVDGNLGFYVEVMGKGGEWRKNNILFWVKSEGAAVIGNIYENPELLGEE
jgi:uncharacterized phage protein (TIGR01671 family)